MVGVRKPAVAPFAVFLLALVTADLGVVHSPLFAAARHDVGALGVVIDLVVVAPLAYWWMIVRRTRVSGLTVVPVVAIGLLAASIVLPSASAAYARYARWLLAPLELALIAAVVVRVRRGLRQYRAGAEPAGAGGDFFTRLRRSLREVLPVPAAADALASEVALLYYALFSWRASPAVRPGARSFSAHRVNGLGALVGVLVAMSALEMTVVHLLVQRWSVGAAWVTTALTLYGVLWMLGFYRAVRLRPVLLDDESLLVRLGLMSEVAIPLAEIESVEKPSFPRPSRRAAGYLRAVALGDPQLVLTLRNPLVAEGLYGRRKTVRRVGLAVDDAKGFRRALEERLAASVERRAHRRSD